MIFEACYTEKNSHLELEIDCRAMIGDIGPKGELAIASLNCQVIKLLLIHRFITDRTPENKWL